MSIGEIGFWLMVGFYLGIAFEYVGSSLMGWRK